MRGVPVWTKSEDVVMEAWLAAIIDLNQETTRRKRLGTTPVVDGALAREAPSSLMIGDGVRSVVEIG